MTKEEELQLKTWALTFARSIAAKPLQADDVLAIAERLLAFLTPKPAATVH